MTTRERLLQVGRQLFAEHGYQHVTVRDISRLAKANLAAVGYHFGDKLNLYRSVVEREIASLRDWHARAVATGGLSAEDRLRSYVQLYLPRMVRPEAEVEYFQRLVRHEMADPTPIAAEIAEQIFRPRMAHLAQLVAEVIGCEPSDRRVRLSVFSIQAQCTFYVSESFRRLVFSTWPVQTPAEIRAAAEHIAEFSIAGMKSLAGRAAAPKRKTGKVQGRRTVPRRESTERRKPDSPRS